MNKNTLVAKHNSGIAKYAKIALVMCLFFSVMVMSGIAPALAAVQQNTALNSVMNTVIDIVTTAAFYIGIVIVIWGVFQIILAFRREDSEGISKQITTVVVGSILVGFGAFASQIIAALQGGSSGTTGP